VALIDIYNQYVTNSSKLKCQMFGAVLVAANDIRNEAPETTNHAERLAWAVATEQNPNAAVSTFLCGMLANPTIAAELDTAPDSDVQFVINSLITTMVG